MGQARSVLPEHLGENMLICHGGVNFVEEEGLVVLLEKLQNVRVRQMPVVCGAEDPELDRQQPRANWNVFCLKYFLVALVSVERGLSRFFLLKRSALREKSFRSSHLGEKIQPRTRRRIKF